MKTILVSIIVAIFALPMPTYANESVDCNAECPEGTTLVSYLDGDTVSCQCAQSAQMDETVPDESVADYESDNHD